MNHLTKTSASEVIPLKGLSYIYIGKHVPFIMSVLTATAISKDRKDPNESLGNLRLM